MVNILDEILLKKTSHKAESEFMKKMFGIFLIKIR